MKLSVDVQSWCDIFCERAEESNHVFWVSQLDYQKHLFISHTFNTLWAAPANVMYEDPDYINTTILSHDSSGFTKHCISRHAKQDVGSTLYQIKTGRGELRWIRDKYTTLYNSCGSPVAAAGVAMDVTDKLDYLTDEQQKKQVIMQQKEIQADYSAMLYDKLKLLCDIEQPLAVELSAREKHCIFLLNKGMSIRQVAEILRAPKKSVDKMVGLIKQKFGCNRTTDLLRIVREKDLLKDYSP